MNYEVAELEIVNRLNQFFTSLNVQNLFLAEPMAESKRGFDEFMNRSINRGMIAVQYMDSIYDPSKSASAVIQEERAKFRLTIENRKVRGAAGLYKMIDLIKNALMGYRLTGSERITISKYGLLEYEGDAWQPYIEIECTMYNFQMLDDLEPEIIGGNGVTGINTTITHQ